MSPVSPQLEPTFSVVVPAFNAERTIAATVRSVLMQTRSDFELLVVDDGSTDTTAERVEELAGDPRVRLLRQPNSGVAIARNTGIAAARGRYVSFLDSDDLWLPSYLETMGAALDAHDDAGFAFTDAWVWDEHVRRFARQTIMVTGNPPDVVPDDPRELFRLLLAGNFIYTSSTVRRAVLAEVGGFNGEVSPAEDWELWLRIAANGHRAIRAAPVLGVYRIRAGSLSSDRAVMRAAAKRLLEVVATEYGLEAELLALVRKRQATVDAQSSPPTSTRPRLLATLARPLARLRSHRLRRPSGVPESVMRLLSESQDSS
jgi:glycosyltransferase involved in cell wall biosynthesis